MRRSLFETLSVPTGYAVELAALVDTAARPRRSTRSRRSTSAAAPTGTSRCATSAAMATQILAGRAPAPGRARRLTRTSRLDEPDGERAAVTGATAGGVRMTLRLGRHEFADDATLMMAIVNRTPDSFYDKGATWAEDKAFERVAPGGRRRAPRSSTSAASRPRPAPRSTPPRRTRAGRGFVGRVRAAYPDLVISVDTWRAEVGRGRLRGGRRRPQRRLGRRRPRAGRRRGRARRRASSAPTPAGVHAAHPPLPDRVRRRGRRRDRRHRRLRRAGRRRRRRARESS